MKFAKLIALALAAACLLCACSSGSENLTGKVPPSPVEADASAAQELPFTLSAARFSSELFKKCYNGENVFISPLSVYAALAMTSEGASGNTARQFKELFSADKKTVRDGVSALFAKFAASLEAEIGFSDAIFIKDTPTLVVKDEFVSVLRDSYLAETFKAPFDDSTAREINSWIKKKTGGKVEKVLDSIEEDVRAYIINAVDFNAKWEKQYSNGTVSGIFTDINGVEQKVDYLASNEEYYVETEKGYGVKKYYAGKGFSFIALLPDDGVSLGELIDSLDAQTILSLDKNASADEVITHIPRFTDEAKLELSGVLSAMGLVDAFTLNADFSGITETEDLYVKRVLHNTHINVSERGTEAGAATVVEIANKAVSIGDSDPKEVYLDRPFVYMIVESETSLPIFIGVQTHVS